MSETTEFKPITEIAREEFPIFYEKLTSFERRLLVDFGKTIRDSDRQHWLEVACNFMCRLCHQGEKVELNSVGTWIHPGNDEVWSEVCTASRLRSAFTAEEKKD